MQDSFNQLLSRKNFQTLMIVSYATLVVNFFVIIATALSANYSLSDMMGDIEIRSNFIEALSFLGIIIGVSVFKDKSREYSTPLAFLCATVVICFSLNIMIDSKGEFSPTIILAQFIGISVLLHGVLRYYLIYYSLIVWGSFAVLLASGYDEKNIAVDFIVCFTIGLIAKNHIVGIIRIQCIQAVINTINSELQTSW